MTEDVNGNAKVTDDSLLLVSGSKGSKGSDKDYVKKLSNAILQVFAKHSTVKMRCVGAASLNNAVKAFIIAKGEAQKNGDNLIINPSFTTVNFNGEEKTGIVLETISVDD
jgi:stage V sporulation protein SpoVS